MVTALLACSKLRAATHNIMAYRIHMPETGAWLADCEDDGETAAGGRLLHLLQVRVAGCYQCCSIAAAVLSARKSKASAQR